MSEPNIVTLTLNPSLDRTLITHYLGIGYHNHTSEATRLDPAGEGFTISRALNQLGCRTHAVVLLGTDATGKAYCALAEESQFPFTALRRPGQTRSSIILMDTGTKLETQITDDGASVDAAILKHVEDTIRRTVQPGDFVVLAGALPGGAPADTYAQFVKVAHAGGARAAATACGAALEHTLPAGPDLITMTQVELEGFFNYPVRELDDIIVCARRLREAGAGRVLVQMRQTEQALLVSEDETYLIELPVEVDGTSSGVWPALIAGYLAGRVSQKPLDAALRIGAAAAGYTSTQVGYGFGTMSDVKEFIHQTTPSLMEQPEADPSDENRGGEE